MEKKEWKRPIKVKKKNDKHVAVCQDCLRLSSDKGMSEDMYFYVQREDHCSLECIDCIEKLNLKISRPYKEVKTKGRPKKIKE